MPSLYLGPPDTLTESPIDIQRDGPPPALLHGAAAGLGWDSPAGSANEVHAILRLLTSRRRLRDHWSV
jgi:hypothetical protein